MKEKKERKKHLNRREQKENKFKLFDGDGDDENNNLIRTRIIIMEAI